MRRDVLKMLQFMKELIKQRENVVKKTKIKQVKFRKIIKTNKRNSSVIRIFSLGKYNLDGEGIK